MEHSTVEERKVEEMKVEGSETSSPKTVKTNYDHVTKRPRIENVAGNPPQ